MDEKELSKLPKADSPTKMICEPSDEVIYNMATLLATHEEIAVRVDLPVAELLKRYGTIIKRGYAFSKISIRRHQYMQALQGNTTMLIYLGKTMLGQCETAATDNRTTIIVRGINEDEPERSPIDTRQLKKQLAATVAADVKNVVDCG